MNKSGSAIHIRLLIVATLARHDSRQLDLLVLDDVHESDSSHVSIVGSLVVVGEKSLALVVAARVFGVEAPL